MIEIDRSSVAFVHYLVELETHHLVALDNHRIWRDRIQSRLGPLADTLDSNSDCLGDKANRDQPSSADRSGWADRVAESLEEKASLWGKAVIADILGRSRSVSD